jgi:nickel transport protein
LGWLLVTPLHGYAHGVEGVVETGGLVVAARYHGGEAMSHARVIITAPNSEKLFQTGKTDKNGRFAFCPDTPGPWRVVVDDETGHRLNLKMDVDEDRIAGRTPPSEAIDIARETMGRLGLHGFEDRVTYIGIMHLVHRCAILNKITS